MSERVITCLAYMNIVAIPYTAYSLYYQKRVVKQWCPLCLAVLAVIWGLFAISLLNGSLSRFSLMTPETLCCVFVSMFLSALGVFLLWKFGIIRRTRQTLWSAVQMLTQKLCCQTIHDCPKVVPLHYESE